MTPKNLNQMNLLQHRAQVLLRLEAVLIILQVLLPTARVLISDVHNNFHKSWAFLDCTSQTSFISENVLKN